MGEPSPEKNRRLSFSSDGADLSYPQVTCNSSCPASLNLFHVKDEHIAENPERAR
ncbi:hypothetical protein LIA77_00817 [Sarocladium implicatum]|nr:hypothetical protein LIA77_00817 [Sarocladium implicatum]